MLRDPWKRAVYDAYGVSGVCAVESGGADGTHDDVLWKLRSRPPTDDIHTIFDKLRERCVVCTVLCVLCVYCCAYTFYRKRQRYLRRVLNAHSKCTVHVNCADIYDEYDDIWRLPQLSQASCTQKCVNSHSLFIGVEFLSRLRIADSFFWRLFFV